MVYITINNSLSGVILFYKISDYLGEVNTDLSDPERLLNMVYYIIGEEVLYDLDAMQNAPNVADEDFRQKMIDEINEKLGEE